MEVSSAYFADEKVEVQREKGLEGHRGTGLVAHPLWELQRLHQSTASLTCQVYSSCSVSENTQPLLS